MLGFAPVTQEVVATAERTAPSWELTLLPFDEIRKIATISKPVPVAEAAPVEKPAAEAELPPAIDPELERQAAEGFLVNGSVNNAAASPFAQARAFGNNRSNQRSLYNGGFGFTLGSSALDARPFSFIGERAPRPDYTDTQFAASFGGPFRIPGVRNRSVLFAGYQRSGDHNASAQSAVVPTLKERAGDFSESRQILDPQTGTPFNGNVIPAWRISPQAAALLALYPEPNVDAAALTTTRRRPCRRPNQDTFQSRVNHSHQQPRFAARHRVVPAHRDRRHEHLRVRRCDDRLEPRRRRHLVASLQPVPHAADSSYQFLRQANDSTPHFANRTNVSGDAGIAGNNQEPVNWGPPGLVFVSGIAGLTTGKVRAARRTTRTATRRKRCGGREAGTTSPSAARSGRNRLTCSGSRTRGARSHSTDRRPDRTSPIFCSVCRIPRPSRSAMPTSGCGRVRSTRTSPTTGGLIRR